MQGNSLPRQKPPTAPAQSHESALTDKPLSPERRYTLASIIAAQLGSLADLKTYVAAAAQGMHSGGGAGGFVWLVTDALGRLGVVPTYGAGTLLVAERRQSLMPDGSELGGIYQPATPPPPQASDQLPPSSSSGRTRHAQARALSTSAQTSGPRPANVWSDPPLLPSDAAVTDGAEMFAAPEAPPALDALGRTLYPLFCVSVHEHAWMAAGYGVWGMDAYLERFWTCLDWAAVREAYAQYAFRK
jgi:Fe-Mn family superoxide dismutase